ncbi:MAG: DUF2029 domain-containing protein [Cryobacterium sp.]|nr:DUF2029 domain-containing protein [Cryobacterium sp.]
MTAPDAAVNSPRHPAGGRFQTVLHFPPALRHPATLWLAFFAVHVLLVWLNLTAYGLPLGDVTIVYTFWVDQLVSNGYWVGIDSAWVYPVLAIVPMLLALAAGPDLYGLSWLVLMTVLNAAAFGTLIGWRGAARNVGAAWWWLAFLFALGPIALGRIDAVTVPLAIIGALLVVKHPAAATVVLTIAAWIKVWPAALVGALIIAARERWRILATALGASAVIIAVALLLGSGGNVLSFIAQQTGRGLQVEAPVSTFWLWRVFGGDRTSSVYYDNAILTWQVKGPGVVETALVMTGVQVLVVLGLIALAIFAMRGGATATELFAPLSLAFVLALIAFNKVGSPQFVSWLAVPVILGLVLHRRGRGWSFAVPALLVGVIAVLTHVMYPYLYGYVLTVHPLMLMVVTVRNALYFVVLAWAVVRLWRLSVEEPEQLGVVASAESAESAEVGELR